MLRFPPNPLQIETLKPFSASVFCNFEAALNEESVVCFEERRATCFNKLDDQALGLRFGENPSKNQQSNDSK